MTTILDALANFESVQLEKAIPVIMQSISAEIVDYNLKQLSQGLTSSGVLISPRYRNPAYAGYKQGLNSAAGFGVPDLKLSGDFYAGFYIQIQGMSFTFGSNDSKSALLEGVYSANGGIFGLSDESKIELVENDLKPKVIEYLTQKTGLPKS
jgi:hypothetical protein